MKLFFLIVTFTTGIPTLALAQGTSPYSTAEFSIQTPAPAIAQDGIITFSEFPIGTFLTNQYSDRGIIFGGDRPFITTDRDTPTSPVLSGTPLFMGSIEGDFVDPKDRVTPTIVQSFSLSAGYFNELGSTRIEWFDPEGNKLGQRANSKLGIENFTIKGGDIARWKISIIEDEPAGYTIDNISMAPAKASVLFRERIDSKKEGTWGFLGDEIPGFDHVGFHIDNVVYESHPGNDADENYSNVDIFVSEDGSESVRMPLINGVQKEHTRKTFEHDDDMVGVSNSPVIDFEEIPIDILLAKRMRQKIETQIAVRAKFQLINPHSLPGIQETLSPSVQKGGNGTFTCVGLIEWAAEQAGHDNGQGFVRNTFESISLGGREVFPLLSPQLLNYAMKYSLTINNARQWFQGLFDPVDFIITDPLGRKLGFTKRLGKINEITKAFFSGDGELEQFLIPNPVAGNYEIELVGLNKQVNGAIASRRQKQEIRTFLAEGVKKVIAFKVELVAGAPGDINRDGCINKKDADQLSASLNRFTNDPNHPGDINGDGLLSNIDLDLLKKLIFQNPGGCGDGLLSNGSFESGPDPGLFLPLNPGDTSINNWTVISSSVPGGGGGGIDYLGTGWRSSHGSRSLDLNGTPGVGGVYQDFTTTPGLKYIVSFDMAGHPSGLLQTMRVSAAGQSQNFTFQSGIDQNNLGWQMRTWEFTARTSKTRIQFESWQIGYRYGGPALDNVDVTAAK
jgi:choice-of-anchor C domain-containing protein